MKAIATISLYCLSFSFLTTAPAEKTIPAPSPVAIAVSDISKEIEIAYNELGLETLGLSRRAFEYAYEGYALLLKKKRLSKEGYLAICDFSQSSKKKRLYIVDMAKREVVLNTYVAHGKKSGGEFATRFSNKPGSHQSSLGFYVTNNTYRGEHGLSLRMTGLERGINDKALPRNIVIHGADYIDESRLHKTGAMGRSFGCPAVPEKDTKTVIELMSNGQCLFIYHPSKKYLNESKILNG